MAATLLTTDLALFGPQPEPSRRDWNALLLGDEENGFADLAPIRAAMDTSGVWGRLGIASPPGPDVRPVPGYERVGLVIGTFADVAEGTTRFFGDAATAVFFPVPAAMPDLSAETWVRLGLDVFRSGGCGRAVRVPWASLSATAVTFDEEAEWWVWTT